MKGSTFDKIADYHIRNTPVISAHGKREATIDEALFIGGDVGLLLFTILSIGDWCALTGWSGA